jgi:hypothetical protein
VPKRTPKPSGSAIVKSRTLEAGHCGEPPARGVGAERIMRADLPGRRAMA